MARTKAEQKLRVMPVGLDGSVPEEDDEKGDAKGDIKADQLAKMKGILSTWSWVYQV